MTSFPNLFKPVSIGTMEIPNRFIMAPLTRIRSEPFTAGPEKAFVPTQIMAEHYSQRASFGLIIAEATSVAPYSAFFSEPHCYNNHQVEGWKQTTEAVHANGGKIFLQLFHPGRAAHTTNHDGTQSVAPTAKPVGNGHQMGEPFTPAGKKVDYETPRALETNEIPKIVEQFVHAAKCAKEAGFDGIELHGANGYLLDEFLRSSANDRTDNYGGSLENRARLLLEVVEGVKTVWDAKQIGVRISPLNSYQDMKDEDPIALTKYVSKKLDEAGIGFLHLIRGDFFKAQEGDVLTPARENFKGLLMVNGGLTPEEAEELIAKGKFDLPCFGSLAMANPDLPARVKAGAKLQEVDWSGAYSYAAGAKGYNDYPFLGQEKQDEAAAADNKKNAESA